MRYLGEQLAIWSVGCLFVLHGGIPATLLGIVLLAAVYARNLEFVHVCIHARFVGGGRGNRWIGTLLALPMLVSFSRWRREHAQHHRDVRREGFRYEYARLTTPTELFLHLFMIRHFIDAAACLARAPLRSSWSASAARVRREYLLIGGYVLVVGISALIAKSSIPLLLFIAPLPAAAILHTHIELPEHFGCQGESEDAFKNSRIVTCSGLVTWFVHYNNYHALHHWDARIPNERLPDALAALGDSQEIATERYGTFFARFYQTLLVARR